jgi:spore coat protein U-like protein
VVVTWAIAGSAPVAWGSGNCSFLGVSGVAFGSYDVSVTSPADSTGSINLQCNPATAGEIVAVTLSAGNSGTFAVRQMLSGTSQLGYNLYLDPARATVWGDGTGGSSVLNVALSASGWTTITQPIYGRIPAGQDVASGTYLDTITVTMNW